MCLLIAGQENKAYSILGAILGRVLPCMEMPDMEALKLLYQDYTGTLNFETDTLPRNVSYLGNDPDRHLIFNEVWEEYSANLHIRDLNRIISILRTFSLNEDFLYRNISSLSGGEKMKVALSLIFADNKQLMVFHGIIPWLDKEGRDDFIKAVRQAKNEGRTIILLEQEFHCLQNVIDSVYELKENTLVQQDKSDIFQIIFDEEFMQTASEFNNIFKQPSTENILEIRKLDFSYHDSLRNKYKPIFKNLNLCIKENSLYSLTGENGTGKSSLANLIFRQETPQNGKLMVINQDISQFSQKQLNEIICYVAQFPENQLIWNTIGDCRQKISLSAPEFVKEIFDSYFPYSDPYPLAYLSYSQLKTLILLTCLHRDCRLLILDEPTWSMDLIAVKKYISLLKKICENMNLSVFIISHAHNLLSLLKTDNLKINNLNIEKL
jgi:energy-coupling factor transport system ATP-binding protein